MTNQQLIKLVKETSKPIKDLIGEVARHNPDAAVKLWTMFTVEISCMREIDKIRKASEKRKDQTP